MELNILVCLDENYVSPLKTMLCSLFLNNSESKNRVWLVHKSISDSSVASLNEFCARYGADLRSIRIDSAAFSDAPTLRYYTQEMYFRLLAPQILPQSLERVLYLDPDILVINPLEPLYNLKLDGMLFAAAAHSGVTRLATEINKLRLKTEHNYYNSGVLLIDLEKGRKELIPQEIFAFAREHEKLLIMPDQDILNSMYGARTLALDDAIWNYDARNYSTYYMNSGGTADLDWVMVNTAILHFCGSRKPWKPRYPYRYGALYKHYMQMSRRGGIHIE